MVLIKQTRFARIKAVDQQPRAILQLQIQLADC